MTNVISVRLTDKVLAFLDTEADALNIKRSRLMSEIIKARYLESELIDSDTVRFLELQAEQQALTEELYEGMAVAISLILKQSFPEKEVKEFINLFFPRTSSLKHVKQLINSARNK